MGLEKCPWCGVKAKSVDPHGGRSGYAEWGCGSWKQGDEPVQSQNCEINVLEAEIERLQTIVARLPKDAEGNLYPPPKALQGKAFYHPSHLGPAPRLFSQLFWHSDGYWGAGCGGWEVPLSECYDTLKAAEAAGGGA